MAAARSAKKPEEVAEHLLSAAKQWQDYLDPAIAENHRWVPNARLHLNDVLKRSKKLVGSLPRVAKKKKSDDDDEIPTP
jgi:hypothetical protein